MKRQGATPKGCEKRVRDMRCDRVEDFRVKGRVTYALSGILTGLVVGIITKARSLRQVETRTDQVAKKHGVWKGIKKRIADNTFSKVLSRLKFSSLVACLHRLIKAEHRRGNLKPTALPVGTVAIDGKNVATLRWHDLCRLVDVDKTTASPQEVKRLFVERYPEAQVCIPENGESYALIRVHTVSLISSGPAVCIHLRPIAGHTNEIASMPPLLQELNARYGRTRLFSLVTTDAGNTSKEVGAQIRRYGYHYFGQVKSGHGEIYAEALRRLRYSSETEADAEHVDTQNGQVVTYHIWQTDLSEAGWLDWSHARQIVRVQRTAIDPETGEARVGNRYYVSSKTVTELGVKSALKISRGHWRCENGTHWTADAELMEDCRQVKWSRHPNGVLSVAVLRMAGLAILAVARYLSRLGHTEERPTWQQVCEHFLLQLCDSVLETEAFDAV